MSNTTAAAVELVNGDRQASYGSPLVNHERIARLFNARLHEKLADPVGNPITPEDVTSLMRLVKEARLIHSPGHLDSLIDIAGYSEVERMIHDERDARV